MLETLYFYFQYDFVIYALITGVLISLCASLIGVTLVLKRFSHIGDGLSHIAFCAMCVAGVMKIANFMPLTILITTVCAVILLHFGQNAKIKGDASVAMLSVGSLAIGYLLVNVFSTSANISGDVCSTLFGSISILTLTNVDVIICVVTTVLVLISFVLFYNKIFAVTFDENFSQAIGVKAYAYNLLIAVISAVVIVVAMNLVGSLLITALLIFPAISAMRIYKTFLSVTICSAIFAVISAALGLICSILISTPVGSTIVVVEIIGFFIFTIIGKVKARL